MKKTVFAMSMIAALILVGCNKETDRASIPVRTLTVSAALCDSSPAEKAVWEDGNGFQWDAASIEATEFGLGVIAPEGATFKQSSSVAVNEGSAQVTFTEVPASFTKAYLFYPWTGSYGHDANTVLSGAWFTISGNQTQAQAGKMDTAQGKVALVSSNAIEASADSYSVSMNPYTSLLRFVIYSSEATDESVKSVSFTAQEGAVVSGNYHLLVENDAVRTETAAGISSAQVSLGTDYSLSGILSKEDASGIYLGVIPVETTGYSYTVVTTKGTYTFESERTKKIEAGKVNNVFLDLKKATAKPGETPVGGDVLTFSYQNMGPFALAKDGSSLAYTGAITALTLNDADILNTATANPDLWSLSVSDDWLIPEFENKGNFQIRVKAKKNPTSAARSGNIYLVYDGVVSETFIKVNQDPGPSYDVIPVLTKAYENAISKDGETVAQAAVLSLTVNGIASTDVAADAAAYGVVLSCGEASASVTDAAGHVQVVFPANRSSHEKTFTLKAGFENESSTVTFTQAAGEGGGDEPTTCPYSFTFEFCGVSTNPGGPSGFNPNFNEGVYFRLRNVRLAGGEADINPTAEQAAEMIPYAFSFEDPESDMPAGYASYRFDAGAITATVSYCATGMVEYHLSTGSEKGYKARIRCKDSDGTVKYTAYAFIPY